jgi:FixJ family two-component response regulator
MGRTSERGTIPHDGGDKPMGNFNATGAVEPVGGWSRASTLAFPRRAGPTSSSVAAYGAQGSGEVDDPDEPLVIVVDDDQEVRAAIEELLISVGIDARGFASPKELLEEGIPDRPGCLVLDVRMPGSSGLALQQHLMHAGNRKPIIFLSGYGDISMSVHAMKAGALDFLTKPMREQTLLDAVALGISRDQAQREEARILGRFSDYFATLTPRERQVMRLVAMGRLNKQIAFDLGISIVTVKLHRSSMMRKMEVRSLGELIRVWESLPEHVREGARQ